MNKTCKPKKKKNEKHQCMCKAHVMRLVTFNQAYENHF